MAFYFEVFDNDGVNGSKSAKTSVMTFEKPTLEEVKMKEDINDEAIKDELKDALKKMDQLPAILKCERLLAILHLLQQSSK